MTISTRRRNALIAVAVIAVTGIVQLAAGSSAGASKPLARATLLNATGEKVGKVTFRGPGEYADRVEVEIEAGAIPNPGKFHGLHVHTTGVCTAAPSGTTNVPFGSAGGHWNPTGAASHGDHAGDLPSPLVTSDGNSIIRFETDRFDVSTLLDSTGDGSAVVLHAGADNFANIPAAYGAPNATTLGTGDAGGRYACGVVQAAS